MSNGSFDESAVMQRAKGPGNIYATRIGSLSLSRSGCLAVCQYVSLSVCLSGPSVSLLTLSVCPSV